MEILIPGPWGDSGETATVILDDHLTKTDNDYHSSQARRCP